MMYHYLECFQALAGRKLPHTMKLQACWDGNAEDLPPNQDDRMISSITCMLEEGGGKQRWGHAKSHQNTKHMNYLLMCVCVCHCLIIFTSLLFHSFLKHTHMCTSILCSKTPTSRWVAKRAVSLCSSIQLQDVTSHVVRATFGTKWNFLLPGAPVGMFK